MEGIFSNFRQNRRIPIKRKLEIIEYAKYHGNNEQQNSVEFVQKQ